MESRVAPQPRWPPTSGGPPLPTQHHLCWEKLLPTLQHTSFLQCVNDTMRLRGSSCQGELDFPLRRRPLYLRSAQVGELLETGEFCGTA